MTEIGQSADPGKSRTATSVEIAASSNNAWNIQSSGALNYNNNKNNNNYCVRPFARPSATSHAAHDIPFSDILKAWMRCEQGKRTSPSCIKFRIHAMRDLWQLWQQIRSGEYAPIASQVFMVQYPVLREVWAAAFRDRVAHTWEAERFGPLIEEHITECGNHSYNCRKGYGQMRAVALFADMLERYTDGYRRDDCVIVGGDFSNFFMGVDKHLLWPRLRRLIEERYEGPDKETLLYMTRVTLMHSPRNCYYRKSAPWMWDGLPREKSLFYMDGVPIGNLPSQLVMNYFGAYFMRWMMQDLGYQDFLIFVDDWRCLTRGHDEARRLVERAREWLARELHIRLHPRKVQIQHWRKGTKMVGAMVMPGRVYISNRTRAHFITTVRSWNAKAARRQGEPRKAWRSRVLAMVGKFRSSVNSYLGMMRHYRSYNIRRRICEEMILPTWGDHVYFSDGYTVMCLKKASDPRRRLLRSLRRRSDCVRLLGLMK